MIDIGGPAMLRAAAKNFVHVLPVCTPDQYGSILAELRERGDIGVADPARARRRGVRAHGGVRGVDRAVVLRPRDVPGR